MTLSATAALALLHRFHAAKVARRASRGSADIGLRTRLDAEYAAARAAYRAALDALSSEDDLAVWVAWAESGDAGGGCNCARTVRELLRARGVVA